MTTAEPERPSLTAVLSAVIRTERNWRGITQQQLALAAGLHPMGLSKIERGIQSSIGVMTLQRLAVALSSFGDTITAAALMRRAESWMEQQCY